MSLVAVPQDVLLELVKELDLADLFNFLSVCRATCELQWEKSLWLHALARRREVEMQPLPLSNVKQLDSMSREELQDTARRAVQLEKNLHFKLDKPVPVKLRTLTIETYASCVCLPGSNLLVTHSYGRLSCWDVLTSRQVAHLKIVGLEVMEDPRIEQDGRALFGALIRSTTAHFAAIYVDYQDPDQVSISCVRSPPTDAINLLLGSAFFVNSDTIGVCTPASTVYWSMETTSQVKVRPPIMPELPSMTSRFRRCLLLGQNIYILYPASMRKGGHVERHVFPPATPPNEPTVWAVSVPNPLMDDEHLQGDNMEICFPSPQVQVPNYGVYAMEYTVRGCGDSRTSVVHFWPAQIARGDIDFGRDGLSYTAEGVIEEIAVGHSGRYVLILFRDKDILERGYASAKEGYLGLLHVEFSPTPHITFRKLEVDGLPPVFSITQLALDDCLGRVLVIDNKGCLTVISYV